MRLLNVRKLTLREFHKDSERPTYAIASHRWTAHEATFVDVRDRINIDTIGYQKVAAFAEFVKTHALDIEWLWIDTCCINKDSIVELLEAVNLMFEWYLKADICLAYLSDVEGFGDATVIRQIDWQHSVWFGRGWTLQELLAPRVVVFLTKNWEVFGNKGGSVHKYPKLDIGGSLEQDISNMTGVPTNVLQNFESSAELTVVEKLAWMEHRTTTKEEDKSYALYGIFDVCIGANYGEKGAKARERLLAAIRQTAAEKAKRFRKISDWISPIRPWETQGSVRNRHEPGTGGWLLEADSYLAWKSGSARHLWLYGPAGSGKTVLCSSAIEDIRVDCNSVTNVGQAIFYFSFSDLSRQTYENLVRSIVVQLGWKEPGLSLLDEAYDSQRRITFGVDELHRALSIIVASYDEIILHLDGLDECPQAQDARLDFMPSLQRLLEKMPSIRMIATSRDSPDIRARMEDMSAITMPLDTQAVDADIRKYVLTQLAEDGKLRQLPDQVKELIEATLVKRANGMFWWACCQLVELKKTRTTKPRAIQTALLTLPDTVDEMYARTLLTIHEEDRRDALVLLRWIAYAKRPLTAQELCETTIIEPSLDMATEGAVDEANRGSWTDSLAILAGLIVVDRWDDNSRNEFTSANAGSGDATVRLAHFSIKDLLESSRILTSDARMFHLESSREHLFLTDNCISYLNHYSTSPAKCAELNDLATFPLLEYASSNWYYHSKSSRTDDNTVRISSLLMSDHRRRDLLRCHQPDNDWIPPFATNLNDFGSSLYYASFLEMENVVREMLQKGANVNAQGGAYGFPLQAAAATGNVPVMQMLLAKGAEINACGGTYSNALIAATRKDHAEAVKLLLHRGATLTVNEDNMTALHYVGSTENTDIADVFLASGVSVDLVVTRKRWNPTHTSQDRIRWSCKDDPDIPQVASATKRGLTPLHYAALIGSARMTKYFIGHGADPNAKSDYDETPLHLTVKKDLHGPRSRDDWNDPRGSVENALHWIGIEDETGYGGMKLKVDGMRNEIVKALVCHEKIDLDAQDYLGLGILHCIPYEESGSIDILSRLLRGKITIDARNSFGQTALHLACIEGNAKAVSLLIGNGASILADDHSGRISIHHAAQGQDPETLQIVLQAAKMLGQRIVALRDSQGWNALHHLVSYFGRGRCGWPARLDAMKCLIGHDVPVNALDNDREPPLALYLKGNFVKPSQHATIVDHLLSTGTDALYRSAEDGRNLAHLAAAQSKGLNVELLETLERYGVRMADKDNHGRTILHHCARNGSLVSAAAATFLCDHVGLSPVAPDDSGETPIDIVNTEFVRQPGHPWSDLDRYWETAQLLIAQARARPGLHIPAVFAGFLDVPTE